jgi:hypothetical protein
MAKKDKYTGPTPEEMDRAARMIEANIPPGSSSRLRDTNPIPSKEEADKQTMEMEKALLKGASMGGMGEALQGMKKGGKVSSASKRADGCCIRGKTKA